MTKILTRAKRWVSLGLTAVMLIGIAPTEALAEVVTSPKLTHIDNEFVSVEVDNATGRFGIRNVDGQPIRKKDQNVDNLFKGENPETSFTTFRINGTDYIFGNPYKFAPDWFSELSETEKIYNSDGSVSAVSTWKIEGVEIKQIITLITVEDKVNAGNVRIKYEVTNENDAAVEVGSRILLDTSVGGNDGPAFQIGQNFSTQLQVERKLVHNPEKEYKLDPVKDEEAYNLHKLPPYWVMRDVIDKTNPAATSAMAYGFNNLFEGGINVVDEMIVGHWAKMAKTKWDYTINPNLDFTTDTNDYGTKDTAVAYYWQPDKIESKKTQTFEVVYGLGEIASPDKVFDIRFLDTVQKIQTTADEKAYENDGIFEINAEVENLEHYNMSHSQIDVTAKLENGLVFVDEDGSELGSSTQTFSFKKPISPEEAAQGIENKPYKPAETINVKWRVKAKGKPWPTTKDYLITVSSPETTKAIDSKVEKLSVEEAKEMRTIYESSRSNFVFLPPIGELTPTYVYGMSPSEVYYEDDKYITLNISNIEGYTIGDIATDTPANFDLFLENVQNGDRYQVPVTDSVILNKSDAGLNGEMRIVYKGGNLVDENGNFLERVDQTLPMGEYKVELVYKDKSDPELAERMSFKTVQNIAVTDNEERRLREANILTVYKTLFNLDSLNAEPREKFEEAFPDIFKENMSNEAFASAKLGAIAALKASKMVVGTASRLLDPELDLDEAMNLEEVPVYSIKAFADEEELEAFEETFEEGGDNEGGEVLVKIEGMVKQIGDDAEETYVVDTSTEPAIINDSVAYTGQDLAFSTGDFALLGGSINLSGFQKSPFLNTLYVVGDGTLAVANSGFVFHQGEWTLDFFNGFNKTLGEGYTMPPQELEGENPEDESLNGSLQWSNGLLGDLLNPFRAIMIDQVYFNLKSMFAAPNFTIGGFGLKFNDFTLRESGVSFGGGIYLKVVEGEVKNVIFNQEGFVGIDSALRFQLESDIGIIQPGEEEAEGDSASGEITIIHYVQDVADVDNTYGIAFEADLKNFIAVNAELSFKQVADGRVLPDVIALGSTLPEPGISVAAATYITALRGAIRELADTIADGGDSAPLTIEAGVDVDFGVDPAIFKGAIDLTLKRTGMELVGKMDLEMGGSDPVEMLTEALIKTQWVTPWFVKAKAEINVCGWDIIIGNASIYIGENLEKHRIDFEGAIGAKLKIPGSVPVAGGMTIGRVGVGVNNDKAWGSFGVLFIEIGITYYWGGGVEFGTDGKMTEEALANLIIQDPEVGPRLMRIGSGIEAVATSWETEENGRVQVQYHSISEGVQYVDDGSQNLGIGGIAVSNQGKQHLIPMNKVKGDALLEVEYFDTKRPNLQLVDSNGKNYPIAFSGTDAQRQTAFEQIVTGDDSLEGTDVRRVYVAVEDKDLTAGTWKLTSNQTVRTKLLSVPVLPKLKEVTLTTDPDDVNAFNASWQVSDAVAGDTVNLYLSKEAMADVPDPNHAVDPGLLIAKDIPVGTIDAEGVASGTMDFDVTKVAQFDNRDIRGMLGEGKYYLRAELRSDKTFGTKTTENQFRLIDPFAPKAVDSVTVKAAGNGMFDVAFPAVVPKVGQEDFEYSYALTALDKDGNIYAPFGEVGFDEAKLKLESSSDSLRHVSVGGWKLIGKPMLDDKGNIKRNKDGSIMMEAEEGTAKYSGLEVGHEYSIGVTVVSKPTVKADKSQNFRFSDVTFSEKTLLPVPEKPVLMHDGKAFENKQVSIVTNQVTQEIKLSTSQSDVKVTAMVEDKKVGEVTLAKASEGQTLKLTDFKTDGTYGIELIAVNQETGDKSVSMLYLTVDTAAPMIYLDQPTTGEPSKDGKIHFKGMTNTDATLTLNDIETGKMIGKITPDKKGNFDVQIPLDSEIYKTQPVVGIKVVALDKAGNSNEAAVEVTNGAYKVPVKLKLDLGTIFKPMVISDPIKATLVYSDGTTGPAELSKLSLKVNSGENYISIFESNRIKGLRNGNATVLASYELPNSKALTAMDVATVSADKGKLAVPDTMATIKAILSGTGQNNQTMASFIDVGHKGNVTGTEFAYKVFAKGTAPRIPVFDQDVSNWTPVNGVMTVAEGDQVVIVKRTVDSPKVVVGTSRAMPAVIRVDGSSSGSGPIIMPTLPNGPIVIAGQNVSAFANKGTILVDMFMDGQKNNLSSEAIIEVKDNKTNVYVNIGKGLKVENLAGVNEKITIPVQGKADKIQGTISSELAKALSEKGLAVELITDLGTYRLPMNQVALSRNSGIEGSVSVMIERGSPAMDTALMQAGRVNNWELLSVPVNFTVKVMENGTEKEQKNFDQYVERLIALPEKYEVGKLAGIVIGDEGQTRPVPTKLVKIDNKYYASMRSMSNSSYAVVKTSVSFKDTAKHWAKASIEALSEKLIVSGTSNGVFSPDKAMTRAEFTVMLTKALGIEPVKGGTVFKDVKGTDWYGPYVGAAYDKGLISGSGTGKFNPNATISREEAMTILVKALKVSGYNMEKLSGVGNFKASQYKDGKQISAWAMDSVALAVNSGIASGSEKGMEPKKPVTRAEIATMVLKLLKLSELL